MPAPQLDLADLMWKTLDPEGFTRMQMESLRMKHPQNIHTDAKPSYPVLEETLMQRAPGYVDTLFQKNEQFKKDVEYGPLSGQDLDKILMNFIGNTIQSVKDKTPLL